MASPAVVDADRVDRVGPPGAESSGPLARRGSRRAAPIRST